MRIFCTLLLCLLVPHAAAQTRAALVVGNCLYEPSKSLDAPENLPNACTDAQRMAQALRGKNFSVLHKENLNTEQMEAALADFKKMLKRGAAGVFYYAGHALQDNKINYLLPVRTDINCDLLTSQLRKLALSAQDVLTEMEVERTAMKILILDACRISPLQNCSRGGRGLASMEKSRGTVISYATDPGKVAYDASGYTPALVRAMDEYGHLPVTQMLRRAGEFMNKDFAQTPWVEATLAAGADFCFGACRSGYVPLPPRKPDVSALLADCAFYFDNDWLLTSPAGEDKTAVACYRRVLAQDGRNRAAFEGLSRVEQRYAGLAGQALDNGNRSAARVYRDRLHGLNADSPLLAALDARLSPRDVIPSRDNIPSVEPTPSPPASSGAFRDALRSGGQGPAMVRIPGKNYALGVYEVTFDEYDRFCSATGREKPDDNGWGRGNRPVINVSWHDAAAYAEWLSAQTGATYRLPNETEWEYAARGGTTTEYWWGDEVGRNHANCDGCGSQWDNRQTAPAGSFPANPYGLHDTAGNVWEWTCGAWETSKNGRDGCISNKRANDARVIRGGSWYSTPAGVRSAYRNFDGGPATRNDDTGFRLARML